MALDFLPQGVGGGMNSAARHELSGGAQSFSWGLGLRDVGLRRKTPCCKLNPITTLSLFNSPKILSLHVSTALAQRLFPRASLEDVIVR